MPVLLRIAYKNLIDAGASLAASSQVGTLTVGNLGVEDIQQVWRAATTPAWIVADLLAPTAIGAVALVNSNVVPADAARVRVSNTDPTGVAGEVYDSGSFLAPVDLRRRILAHFLASTVLGTYVRIDLAQSEAPQAGRLFVGPVWAPTRNRAYGAELLYRDWSEQSLTRGLNLIRDRRARQRGHSFTLRGLTKAEVDQHVVALNEDIGTSADILTCLDVDDPAATAIWGPMEATVRSTQPAHNFYVADFTVWNRL